MKISEWIDSESEKTSILDLTKKTYGDSEISSPSYYDWLYRQNPQGKPIIFLAKDEEKNDSVIGMEPIVPMKLIIDQNVITSYLSCNSIVHPDYRKKGIFSKLLSLILDKSLRNEISCVYSVPNERSFNAFIRGGFTEIAKLPLLVKPLRFSKYFDEPLRSIIRPFDSIWKINNYSNIEPFTDRYNTDFDSLANKVSKRVSIIQKRDKEFLQWRYANHPTRKYQTFVLREDSVLKGYIITRETTIKEKTIGVIVDFMVDAEIKDQKKLKDLVNAALANFWKNDVSLAIATCRTGLLENKILHEAGFHTIPKFLKPESLHLIVLSSDSANSSLTKLKEFNNWFFSFGDYDVF